MAAGPMALRALVMSLLVLAFASQLRAQTCTTSIYDAVVATEDLAKLKVVIDAAGLTETLSDKTLKVTVVAPNNAAFDKLEMVLGSHNLTLGDVAAPEANKAASILLYHVIPAVAFAKDLQDKQTLPTLLGENYNLNVDLSKGVSFIASQNTASVVKADVPVCDSVVHIIDAVLIPAPLAEIPDYMPPMEAMPPMEYSPPYEAPAASPPPPDCKY